MKPRFKKNKKTKAQVLVEYLLLMVITVSIATIMTKQLINRDANSPGIFIGLWNGILTTIGQDVPDCSNPNCQP